MRKLIILVLLNYSVLAFSQTNTKQIFKNLPSGAILVRLTSKAKTIESIKDKKPVLAEKIDAEQKIRNQEIIDAFENGFSLCPVFYFYDYNSRKIRDKNFKDVLLDKELNPITDVSRLKQNYLIAEFGETKGDSIHIDGERQKINKQGKIVERRDTSYIYYTGYNLNAVVLYTPDLVSVQRPLPRYARKYPYVFPRTSLEMVQRLQEKIEKYIE